jgi:hypothetical protein
MYSKNFPDDFTTSAMEAWNVLTRLMDDESKCFDDLSEFESFYNVIIEKLHEEDQQE